MKTGYTKVKDYSDKELLNKVKSLSNFSGIPSGYWILGVRSKEDTYNVYDDKFYIFKGEKFVTVLTGTTNPGSYGLKNFLKWNKRGVAVVKADKWYYSVWRRGMHKNKIPALIQVKPFTIIRDNDGDNKSGNSGNESEESGIGINFHPNNYNLNSTVKNWIIGGWSEGCQVTNDIFQYKKFLRDTSGQDVFTYCLINEF